MYIWAVIFLLVAVGFVALSAFGVGAGFNLVLFWVFLGACVILLLAGAINSGKSGSKH